LVYERDERLSVKARAEIEDVRNNKFVSTVSLWEIVIKSSKNKLELNQSFDEINQFLSINNIKVISVEVNHLSTLLNLPYHHADPFDRMLIAQAQSENLTILSADRHFAAYSINVIW
jgi:PIN domain nuclease of toxin-antitoxin system